MKRYFLLACSLFSAASFAMEYKTNRSSLSPLIQKIIDTYDRNQEFRKDLSDITELNIPQKRIKINDIDKVTAAIEKIQISVDAQSLSLQKYLPDVPQEQAKKIETLIKALVFDFLLSRSITLYGSLEEPTFLSNYIKSGHNKNLMKILLRVCSCPKFNIVDRMLLVLKVIDHALTHLNDKKNITLMSFGAGKGLQEFIIAEWLQKLAGVTTELQLIEDNKENFDPNYIGIRASITDLSKLLNDNNPVITNFNSVKQYLKSSGAIKNPDIGIAVDLDERIAPKTEFTDMTYIFLNNNEARNPFLKIIYHPSGRCRAFYATPLNSSLSESQKDKLITAVNKINMNLINTNSDNLDDCLALCDKEIAALDPKFELQLTTDPYYQFQLLIDRVATKNSVAFAAQNHKTITFIPKKYNGYEFISPFDVSISDDSKRERSFTSLIDNKIEKTCFLVGRSFAQ